MSLVMSLVNKLLGNRQVRVQVLSQCGRFPRSTDRVLDTQREIFCSGLCLRSSSSLTDLVLPMITRVGMCLRHPHPALWLAVCFQSVGSAYWISSQGFVGFVRHSCQFRLSLPYSCGSIRNLCFAGHQDCSCCVRRVHGPVAHWLMPSTRADVWFCRSAPWPPAASALEKLTSLVNFSQL